MAHFIGLKQLFSGANKKWHGTHNTIVKKAIAPALIVNFGLASFFDEGGRENGIENEHNELIAK